MRKQYLEVFGAVYAIPGKNVKALIQSALDNDGAYNLNDFGKETKYKSDRLGGIKVGRMFHYVHKVTYWDIEDW